MEVKRDTMTIDLALKILETFFDQAACTLDATSANAFKLGIEALKIVKGLREGLYDVMPSYLPGEKEE